MVIPSLPETVIAYTVRKEMTKETYSYFYRYVNSIQSITPFFTFEGINYIYVKKLGIYFVATTMHNVMPASSIELIERIINVSIN